MNRFDCRCLSAAKAVPRAALNIQDNLLTIEVLDSIRRNNLCENFSRDEGKLFFTNL